MDCYFDWFWYGISTPMLSLHQRHVFISRRTYLLVLGVHMKVTQDFEVYSLIIDKWLTRETLKSLASYIIHSRKQCDKSSAHNVKYTYTWEDGWTVHTDHVWYKCINLFVMSLVMYSYPCCLRFKVRWRS